MVAHASTVFSSNQDDDGGCWYDLYQLVVDAEKSILSRNICSFKWSSLCWYGDVLPKQYGEIMRMALDSLRSRVEMYA